MPPKLHPWMGEPGIGPPRVCPPQGDTVCSATQSGTHSHVHTVRDAGRDEDDRRCIHSQLELLQVVEEHMLISDLEQTLFWNRDSPIWIFFWRLPITEWELPVSEQGLYYFLSLPEARQNGDPHFRTGLAVLSVLKQGSPF
jgi:hypothetical protein